MAKRLDLRFEDNVAILEMTNGKNAFTHEFLDDLNAALDKVLSNKDISALVTYGGPGRHYSDGIDLATVGAEGMHSSLKFSRKLCQFMARLTLFPMPTVAAVNGHGFAGGCILALCHDYKVMNSDKGWLCLPEVNMPQLFPIILLEILKAKIPNGNPQRDLIVMGKRLTSQDALAAGIIDQRAPPGQILQQAVTLARSLVKNGQFGRDVMQDMKKDTYRKVVESLDESKINFMTSYVLQSKF